ncbi:hypothetical protein BDZ85DRAFT_314289 [Elsinoe ampelina]|uniref:Glycosyl transferase CAP10 domain-containing protein n=1 Tax=Elsinoe ampelina TaxID=302913 RepID=A0A6A6G8A7_9PEZI|nr:hypothetical protein BDZ85DRAFT_314289 [Elsinoe ampelina]
MDHSPARAPLSHSWPLSSTWPRWLSKQDWTGICSILLSYCSTHYIFESADSWAYDRPVHLALIYLVTLAVLGHFSKRFLPPADQYNSHDESIHLLGPQDGILGRLSNHHLVRLTNESFPTWARKPVLALVLALGVRIVTFKQMTRHAECLTLPVVISSVTLLPLYMALEDFGRSDVQLRDPIKSVLEPGRGAALERRRRAFVLIGSLLYAFGSVSMRIGSNGPRSSVICPASGLWLLGLPASAFQFIAALADLVILLSIAALLLSDASGRQVPVKTSVSLLSLTFGITSMCVIFHGIIWFAFVPEDRYWTISIPLNFLRAAFRLDLLVCGMAISATHSIIHLGMSGTVFNVCISMAFGYYFSSITSLPAWSVNLALVGFWITCGSCIFQAQASAITKLPDRSTAKSSRQQRLFLGVFFGFLLLFGTVVQLRRPGIVDQHPIDRLIHDAKGRHQSWKLQAKTSKTLSEAVMNYEQRYNQPPPPGFDKWYAFAVSRNSNVIDDFDSIWRDLEPFSLFQPNELRSRTWEAMSSPDNDVTGLAIRGGKTSIYKVRDTHRWMMEGVQRMIRPFEEHIPDMDLAFNTNDETRVMAGLEGWIDATRQQTTVQKRHATSTAGFENLRPSFSQDRAGTWQDPPPDGNLLGAAFDELSYQNIFQPYGARACPNRKAMAAKHVWDRSQLCTTCIEQHSDVIFLSDWRLSNDICSQPDLGHLHGFFASPASFKGTHKLLPIFSQSKAPKFNDILYPSAWNYMDKAIYSPTSELPDPIYAEKKSILFWRGATTEGVSASSNAWTGFVRQRFHQLLNSRVSPSALVLLPTSSSKYKYTYLPSSHLRFTLSPDVKFTDPILRCGEPDCTAQAQALKPLVAPTDFQSHWTYKYLLDLDGAGFSGRFLPFLQSRSLPFKAALFREWYDDRVEAWAHFVPLDLRGTGLWATLVYFMGWPAEKGREHARMRGREEEGMGIAEAGREWAGQVLRKEDMEVYMFRLLLEWGRLTDDRRGEIGFTVEEARRVEREWEGKGMGGG